MRQAHHVPVSSRMMLILALSAAFAMPSVATAEKPSLLEAKRLAPWASMLPPTPHGVGRPISDRQAWKTLADAPAFKSVVPTAKKLLSRAIPPLTDDLYLDYSRTGNRTRCQQVLGQRQNRFPELVLAECLENRGRFLPAIEEAILAVCGDKTWVLPAHDSSLTNFKGTEITIDLRAAEVAWNLATTRFWLGDRLSEKTRKRIDAELERRIFTPFAGTITTGKPKMWWLSGTNNWNAVCLAGVTGAALANVESRERRATFAAAAEQYIQNFLRGFTPDGYCSEGLGYWNYGFGHYVMLAETLRQASGRRVDWIDAPQVRQIAMFGRRMEILPGIFPAFADCSPKARPDLQLMAFLSRRHGWGLSAIESKGLGPVSGPSTLLFKVGLYGFANSATATPKAKAGNTSRPLRDWFPDAGVLICRPANNASHAMGVALKGGHNAEHHNHNDLGSFVVVLGRSTPLLDPGNEVYTRRTFGKQRYDSNMLNSFGHAVPRVAGRLQETGPKAAARVLKTEFTDAADTLVLDLSSAYKVEGLIKLERTFVFSREGEGRLTITDEVEFDSPRAFGTALVTFDPWKQIDARRLHVGNRPDGVVVTLAATGGEMQIHAEPIQEDLPGGRIPTRLGIDLARPAVKAKITLAIAS